MSTPQKYPLANALVDTLLSLQDWLPNNARKRCALDKWLKKCAEHLDFKTIDIPQKPSNYSREAKITCRCADCKELIGFLTNSSESTHRFRIRKERRQHLHEVIEKHNCDTDHVTDRKGSPQTLVCTKNIDSYQRAMRQYEEDRNNLAAIKSLHERLTLVWAR